jgi:acyl carrier protein
MNAQLKTILRRYLVLVPEGQDVPLETELPALGLDSMSALTLLLELEEIFDISFPDSLLNATTFRSAKSLENVIQMLRKQRDGQAQDTDEFMGGPNPMRLAEPSSSRPIGGTARR